MVKTIIAGQVEEGARSAETTSSARWALASLALSVLLSALGTSIANVALPNLAEAFNASFQAVQWIVIAYLLAITTLIVGPFYLSRSLGLEVAMVGLVLSVGPVVAALTAVPAGRLADRLGTQCVATVGLIGMATGAFTLSMLPTTFGIPGYIAPSSSPSPSRQGHTVTHSGIGNWRRKRQIARDWTNTGRLELPRIRQRCDQQAAKAVAPVMCQQEIRSGLRERRNLPFVQGNLINYRWHVNRALAAGGQFGDRHRAAQCSVPLQTKDHREAGLTAAT